MFLTRQTQRRERFVAAAEIAETSDQGSIKIERFDVASSRLNRNTCITAWIACKLSVLIPASHPWQRESRKVPLRDLSRFICTISIRERFRAYCNFHTRANAPLISPDKIALISDNESTARSSRLISTVDLTSETRNEGINHFTCGFRRPNDRQSRLSMTLAERQHRDIWAGNDRCFFRVSQVASRVCSSTMSFYLACTRVLW